MTEGKLICIEGADGAGKSTQIKAMVEKLRDWGIDVVQFREPGGTEVGEKIRDILLNVDMDPFTELMLFTASRIENIKQNILPALQAGKVVVLDRFVDSTMAYQGYGRGLRSEVAYLMSLIDNLVKADYVLFLDIPFDLSIERLKERIEKSDRLDQLDFDTKRKIFAGFQVLMHENPERNVVINAVGTRQEVEDRITNWIDTDFMTKNLHLCLSKGVADETSRS